MRPKNVDGLNFVCGCSAYCCKGMFCHRSIVMAFCRRKSNYAPSPPHDIAVCHRNVQQNASIHSPLTRTFLYWILFLSNKIKYVHILIKQNEFHSIADRMDCRTHYWAVFFVLFLCFFCFFFFSLCLNIFPFCINISKFGAEKNIAVWPATFTRWRDTPESVINHVYFGITVFSSMNLLILTFHYFSQ